MGRLHDRSHLCWSSSCRQIRRFGVPLSRVCPYRRRGATRRRRLVFGTRRAPPDLLPDRLQTLWCLHGWRQDDETRRPHRHGGNGRRSKVLGQRSGATDLLQFDTAEVHVVVARNRPRLLRRLDSAVSGPGGHGVGRRPKLVKLRHGACGRLGGEGGGRREGVVATLEELLRLRRCLLHAIGLILERARQTRGLAPDDEVGGDQFLLLPVEAEGIFVEGGRAQGLPRVGRQRLFVAGLSGLAICLKR